MLTNLSTGQRFWRSMCQFCTRSPDHFIAHKSNYGQHAVYGVNVQHKNESLILFNYKCQRLAIARRNLITIWFCLSLVLVTTGPRPDQREITRPRSSPPLLLCNSRASSPASINQSTGLWNRNSIRPKSGCVARWKTGCVTLLEWMYNTIRQVVYTIESLVL